jgi:hypothetical protein
MNLAGSLWYRGRPINDAMIHVNPASSSQRPIPGYSSSGIPGTAVGQRRNTNKIAGTRLPGKLPQKILPYLSLLQRGRGGIRTHGTVTRTPDFESGAFDQLSHPSIASKSGFGR